MHTLADPRPPAELPEDEEVFVFPLSFAQQRLWFIDRMEPGNPFYNLPAALLLEGALDAAALERALGEVVARHEALRTVFDEEEGEPVQVVLPPRPFALPLHDLSGWTEEERRAEVERRSATEARRSFDLRTGPLFRAELLRLSAEEHVLFLTMHHVVGDAWSVGVLLRELGALYEAFARGEESPLEPLPIQYADFAVWQRERLSGERLDAQLAYWRGELADPPVLDLPLDRPRPAAPSYRGGSVELVVPAATAAALRGLARAEGATLFMALLAAWQTLLARWAGQDDVVVGTPIAGRNRAEIEGLIGFFVNTLALRADLSGNPTFRELLRQVRERTFGAYAHEDLPFERVVEELRVERDPGRSPVFQVMFSLQNAPDPAPPPAGLRMSLHGAAAESAKYDLVLTAADAPGEIPAQLAYALDLFDRETAARMASHLAVLLDAVAAAPDTPVADLPLMGAAERRRVLEEWNDTRRDYPAAPPVHERILAHAARTPGAPAVLFRDRALTFAELERAADDLARRLRSLGVGPESRVGLLLERSPDTVVCVLAVLRAGGAYVALDPAHPDERLRFVLSDTAATVVVAHPALAGRVAGFGGEVVVLGAEETPLPPVPSRATVEWEHGAGPESLAYVIYTSGSTGTPKGVLATHRNLSNYLDWIDETVPRVEGLAFPLVSPLGFDAHVRQLFLPLLRGDPAWVIPDEEAGDPAALLSAVAGRGRVAFSAVPSLWGAMLELVRSGEAPRPAGLVEVRIGGEALPPELAERTFALFPDVPLWNHYGPTETTVNATAARVRPGGPVTLGRPVGNARARVLDDRLAPAPTGVPGELYVGGAGVTRGYLGRPDLTADRYLPDPFAAEPGARMYRTGDRVRWLPGGELEYLGRVDRQVKVRGFRIELGEVEAALRAHPSVRAAAVVAREDGPGGRRLVGYYVPAAGAGEGEAVLRDWLRARLPEYMVPSALVALEALPLTPAGKLDPRRLPAPADAPDAGGWVAPRTPAEEIVAGIWAEVLKRERVGAHDDFFESGGHSLLATRVVSRLRAAFGVEVPLRAVFEAPTVAGLAERVDAAVRAGGGTGAPPLVPVPRGGPLPTSFAQQRLWFIQQMDPASIVYNMPYALRLRGALHPAALGRALDALRARHESLRTTFATVDGAPVQVVAPPEARPLPVEDLRALPPGGREAAARARLE
ncbi:MAG TPA: amino acid adenylation domain-containing protein, partial [Longimicrobiaceae bacterium]|nr:amino acid adenylation domain-containing protein [Longimicrobiaceae bacterium]